MKIKTRYAARQIWFASILLFLGQALLAQEAADKKEPRRKLSVDEAVSLALENNLGLKASQIALEKKKRPAQLFWNQFLPAVGVSGSLSAANKVSSQSTPIGVDPNTGRFLYTTVEGSRWGLSGAFQIQWEGLNFALFEGIKQLKLAYEAGGVTHQKARLQLERDIRKLYGSMVLAHENLKVQERSFSLAEEQVRTANANYRAGLSAELSLMQATLNRDNMIPSIDQVRNDIKVAMARLALITGLPLDTEFELEMPEETSYNISFDVWELMRNAASNKMDIKELRSEIIATRSARNAIRYQLWTPSLSLGWSTMPTFVGNPFKDEWKSDNWTDRGSFNLSLRWSLNGILPFTTQAATLRDMDDNLRAMDMNLALKIRETEVEVYNTVFLIQQARESAEAQQRTVDLAKKTYNDTLTAFRAGLRDFLEVQSVEQQMRQAELGILQQQFNFINGVIDLEYAIGVPFGSLAR